VFFCQANGSLYQQDQDISAKKYNFGIFKITAMKRIYFFALLTFLALNAQAQIIEFPYNQGFEGQVFPPEGWLTYPMVAGDMEFVRVTEGEWPDCLPHDGSLAMAQYNSFNASAGEEAILMSPEMILSEDNVLRFWFFRSEDPSNNRRDKIEVYYNSLPNLDGATLLDTINRAFNFYPQESSEDWYQYDFEFNNVGSTYIIFKAVSAYGWKMFLDDVEVNTNSIDTDPPVVISLDGAQVYAWQQMNLTLRVRDDSEMPQILEGETIIDGETFEIILTKTGSSRGDYIYEGNIAGQPDHTEGEIRFWLIDVPENATWSEYYPLHWDWVQPIMEESFEGEVFPPENWTITGQPLTWLIWNDYGVVDYIDSDNVEWEVVPPHGQRQAAVEWDFQGNSQDEWMISPQISIPENAVLTFKTFARLNSYDYDEYLVNVSTDGFTWNTLWSAADYPAGVSDYNEDISLSLSNYTGSDIRIAWRAYNLMGGNLWYSWFVDDVKIRTTDTIVGIQETTEPLISRATPNPFTNYTQVNFKIHKTSNVSLDVFGNDGSRLIYKIYPALSPGYQCIKVDGSELPPGFYFYQITTDEGTFSGKLIRK